MEEKKRKEKKTKNKKVEEEEEKKKRAGSRSRALTTRDSSRSRCYVLQRCLLSMSKQTLRRLLAVFGK